MVMEEVEKITLFMKAQKVSKFSYNSDGTCFQLKAEFNPDSMEEMIIENQKTEQEILQQELEDALRSV